MQGACVLLHPRFQVAIDKAAVKAGRKAMDDYIAEWRKTQAPARRARRGGEGGGRAPGTRLHARRPGPPAWPPVARTRPGGAGGGMTRTVIGSTTREVVIGDDQPFVLIGERINPTGRKLLAEEMKAGDFSRVERDVVAQVEAGAHMLDVNAGVPLADEPAMLAHAIQLVQALTDLPLSIDSSIVEALEAGLAAYQGKALVNSVTGEDERLERVLPLVAPVRGGGRGHLQRRDRHLRGPRRPLRGRETDRGARRSTTASRARTWWWTRCSCPSGRCRRAGRQVFRILRRLRDELHVNTICGASNVSFGLPFREGINGAYLAMAIASGLTSAITNPLSDGVRQAVMAADVLMGNDPECGRWIRRYREAPAEGEQGRRINRRRAAAVGPPPAEAGTGAS